MKLLSLIILGVWLHCAASAQAYFNKRETLHSIDVQLWSVVESRGKYYCTGWGDDSARNRVNDTAYTLRSGIRFAVFEASGTRLLDTIYMKPHRIMETVSNSLVRLTDESFLLAVDDYDTFGHPHLLLINFDSLGHVQWDKEYDKPICSGIANDFWQLRDFRPDGNGNWLMLSTIECAAPANTFAGKMLLTKLDSSYKVIWNKDYGDGKLNSVAGHLLVEGNGYVMAGFNNAVNVDNSSSYSVPEIFKTDTAGNQLWHWLGSMRRHNEWTTDIIRSRDGGYIYCGSSTREDAVYSGQGGFYCLPWIEKIDSLRNPVWHNTISYANTNVSDYNIITSIKELASGDIMASGNIVGGFEPTDIATQSFGILVRLQSDGSIKWKRKYRNAEGDTMIYQFKDMKQTSDGGYVMCGQAIDLFRPYIEPVQRAWLVKVDSNGCASSDDPQCWAVAVPPLASAKDAYEVYPNPAKNVLNIRYTGLDNTISEFSLTDITGRLIVRRNEISMQSRSVYSMTMAELAPGTYFLRITDNKGLTGTQKITKE